MNNNRGSSSNNNNNNRRRGRGNNNRPQNGGGGGQQVNRIDSRARGNAPQLLEKYRKMAQDAHMNGDRVQAEYYLQFADHYFRVTADTRVRMEEQRLRQTGGQPGAPNGSGYVQGYQNGGGVSGDQWQDQDGEDEALEFGMDANFPTYDRAPRETNREQPNREQGQRDQTQRDQTQRDQTQREQGQREQAPRDQTQREQTQRDQNRRDEQPRRDDREANYQPREQQRDNRQRTPDPVAEAAPAEGMRADEGDPIAQGGENPFVRDGRGPRGPRGRTNDRRIGRREDNDAPRPDSYRQDPPRTDAPRTDTPRNQGNPRPERPDRVAEAAPAFDPSILPPAIGIRNDTVIEAPARPERTRVTKPVAVAAPVVAPAVVVEAQDAPAAPKKRGRPRKNPLPEAQPEAQVDAEG